jgi:hypothetical protein
VAAKPPSFNGRGPVVLRIRGIDAGGFDITVQEWEYQDGAHKTESVGYIVLERGNYVLSDGTLVEAGRFETDRTGVFKFIAFDKPFDVEPVVVATICSYNEQETVIGRVRNVSTLGFEFTMQEQELNVQQHAQELISYIAWEPSSGTIADMHFEVDRTENVVTDIPYTIRFNDIFEGIPVFIADMQTADGLHTANLRWQNKSPLGIDVMVDEEKSVDQETGHTKETVGHMVFGTLW